jgi:DNA-directed RNA polymerase alpha subunit
MNKLKTKSPARNMLTFALTTSQQSFFSLLAMPAGQAVKIYKNTVQSPFGLLSNTAVHSTAARSTAGYSAVHSALHYKAANKFGTAAGLMSNTATTRANGVLINSRNNIKKQILIQPLDYFRPFFLRQNIYRASVFQTKAFSDQFLSILTDSFYSPSIKKEITSRNEKLSKNYFMSCKESIIINNRSFYSRFYLGPFDSGQSITVANAIRRTLLSELSGLAITTVEIEGVTHEYSSIPGVKDTVLDILLNLKEIVIKSNYILDVENGEGFIQVRGPGVIRAADIKLPSYLLCVDPDQYIATLSDDGVLNIKISITSGKSYLNQSKASLSSEKNKKTSLRSPLLLSSIASNAAGLRTDVRMNASGEHSMNEMNNAVSSDLQQSNSEYKSHIYEKTTNLLLLDPVFTPITKVNYIVEQNPQDFSSQIVVLEIWTNGSIHPRKALYDALKKLINIFSNLTKIKMLESPLKSNKTYTKMQKLLECPETNSSLQINASSPTSILSSFEKNAPLNRNNNTSSNLAIGKEDISMLSLSLRSYNCLKNAEINNIGDLVNSSVDELLNKKKIEKRVIVEVQKKLRKKGVFL